MGMNMNHLGSQERRQTGKEAAKTLQGSQGSKGHSVSESGKGSLGLRGQRGSEAQLGPTGTSRAPRVHFTEKSQPVRKSTYLRF